MNEDLKFHLRSITRFIYFVTDEEDLFIEDMKKSLEDLKQQTFVYNSAFGLQPIKNVTDDWRLRSHNTDDKTENIQAALTKIYTDDPMQFRNFYIITDPDRWLKEEYLVRRFLNIAHQLTSDDKNIKILIFVGPRLVIPQKLRRYIEVVHDKGMAEEQTTEILQNICTHLEMPLPDVRPFKGLTRYEIDAAVAQSVIKNRVKDPTKKVVFSKDILDYKRRQLKKTDLLEYQDTTGFTFDALGGADRFKAWAMETKDAWTEEGQAFGLTPPRGVLLAGIWGCGKSLAVKALANAWGLQVVRLELGKLRSSGVGDSEANVYKALHLIEAVAPCVVMIDEAEKSLSGAASSAQTDSGTTSRMLASLSTWIQETNAPVCLALTANTLNGLPTEIINRMDERFFFDLPTEDERMDILKIHLRKTKQDLKRFNFAILAEAANNLVGREIEQAIRAAMRRSYNLQKESLDPEVLLDQLKTKPRLLRTMGDAVKELLDWVGFDPEVGEGVRAKFASSDRVKMFSGRVKND